jgi:hypothetical protein
MFSGKVRRLTSVFSTTALALCLSGDAPRAPLADPATASSVRLTDAEMLDAAQAGALGYFTDFAHPVSGMARERTNNVETYGADIVTTGGTGFGVMAMIAGAERGFLTREDALARTAKIVDFLSTKADRFHGLFPHYMDGTTGKTFAWNKADDGADVVESSFLFQGLLAARQYYSRNTPEETALRDKINGLWRNADWTWHARDESRVDRGGIIWNWSPSQSWKIGLPIRGWNECLITYVMAASSPTHPISRETYAHGWAQNGAIRKNMNSEGYDLPLGGGPLFFAQYSFLGLDPRGLKDSYADYGIQTRNQALAQHAYAVRNPKHFKGYGPAWGLTASDGTDGYDVFSPENDKGVIAPTAALSSFPYTPEFSMQALRHYTNDFGGALFGRYGFVDSFDETRHWQAKTELAIDEGPIAVMIENYRSGLLWDLFMSAPEVQQGLKRLGFESPHLDKPAANAAAGSPTIAAARKTAADPSTSAKTRHNRKP